MGKALPADPKTLGCPEARVRLLSDPKAKNDERGVSLRDWTSVEKKILAMRHVARFDVLQSGQATPVRPALPMPKLSRPEIKADSKPLPTCRWHFR
jgi:hypothetical protein